MADTGGWQKAGGENSQMAEPNFDDPEDYLDEITNEDLLPDLLAKESAFNATCKRLKPIIPYEALM